MRCEKDKTKWTFPCRQWLASDMHDGKMVRTLLACKEEARASRYTVTVYTSDRVRLSDRGVCSSLLHPVQNVLGGGLCRKSYCCFIRFTFA